MNKLNIFLITGNPRKCKKNQNTLKYIIRAIAMLFLHANVIPVNPQIHSNIMRPLFVLGLPVIKNIFNLFIAFSAFCSMTDDAI
jgi:hypothetical protein